MTISRFRPILPGKPLSAAELNRLAHEAEVAARLQGTGGIVVQRTHAGTVIENTIPEPIWIKITSGTQPYAWTEQKQDAAGMFVNHTAGRSGTTTNLPAYEANGSADVAADTIVRAWLHPSKEWYIFVFGGGGSIQIQDEGNDVTPVRDTINFTGQTVEAFDDPVNEVTEVLLPDYGTTTDIQPVGEENFAGISDRVARADHVHAFEPPIVMTGSGDGFPPAPPGNPYQPIIVFDFSTGVLIFWNPTFQVWQQINCCDSLPFNSSGLGGIGGGDDPPPVDNTGCCLGDVPGVLIAVMAQLDSCFGTGFAVELAYAGANKWQGVRANNCGVDATFVHAELECVTGVTPGWQLRVGCQNFATPFMVPLGHLSWFKAIEEVDEACPDPFEILFASTPSGFVDAPTCYAAFDPGVTAYVIE